jgi:DNA polymerase-3 subunit gamma/tau
MSYVVLARKWRPMKFEDLVGQEHVARTLANAIQVGRVAHAFLFTGVRGVGKTTSARILAKALNCQRKPGTVGAGGDPGPTATPCLECSACAEIAAGSDVDVREIDGASYNGVDEVRKLQDSIPYRPSRDRYKIFIVDEVHMLSQSAWNAFLKTLEEPPPHVKFIFATTEVHKIPITILSRVQRFDFKLIPARLIMDRLRHVLEKEGITADEGALSIIAREAAGSMRDAMSLVDQAIAWGGDRLDEDGVARVLGVASRQVLHDVAQALLVGDAERCLGVVGDLVVQSYDMGHVARDLLGVLRDLVVARVCPDPAEHLDLPVEEQRDLVSLAGRTELDDLLRLHQGFSQGYDDVVRSGQPRAALEMLLIRLARRPPLWPIDDLLNRLGALERRLGVESSRPGGAAPAARRSAPPTSGGLPAGARSAALTPAAPASPDRVEAPQPKPNVMPDRAEVPPPKPNVMPDRAEAPQPKPGIAIDRASTLGRWRAIVDRVRARRPDVAAVLDHAAPLAVSETLVELGWADNDVLQQRASEAGCFAELCQAVHAELGASPRVTFAKSSAAGTEGATLARIDAQAREDERREAVHRVRTHPRVSEAMEILGARLKDVKLPPD